MPVEELEALKKLIRLQRESIIIIKPCNKGAGTIILDFTMYMQACNEHLFDKQIGESSETKDYYLKVVDYEIKRSMNQIRTNSQEGLGKEIISIEELNAMDPSEKILAKFHMTLKVHNHTRP